MKRFLLSLMASLVASCVVVPAADVPVEQLAFADACRVSKYDCTGLTPPRVRHSPFVTAVGALGVYVGGRTVYLAPEVHYQNDTLGYAILVHEMVHYLQVYADDGSRDPSHLELCLMEQEAWEVTNVILRERGLEAYVREFPYDSRCRVRDQDRPE